MPQDSFRPRGLLKANKPGAGGASIYPVPVIGVVKDNIDPTRSGRIKVSLALPNSSGKSDEAYNWISVSYLSTFFGKVTPTASNKGYGTYKTNSSSYGQWQAPPDIGTQVICIFVNGDPNYGYYIGCIPEAESLHMVPAIGSSDNILTNEGEANSYGGSVRLPVANMNTNDKSKADSNEFLSTARPVHSYTAAIMNQQGIIRDPIRGPISSSASRETVSRVGWGVSTPGRPIYEGGYDDQTLPKNLQKDSTSGLRVIARRGGHSIVMDDGDIIGRDQLIRIRTSLGHQILMSDDGQTLMILHSNGQSYIELGKEGTIDMYSTNSVNVRTQGDLNLHADRNVNIHAAENLNIQAKQIHTNSEEITQMRVGSDYKLSATGKITGLSGDALALKAGGDASLFASGLAYVNGSKVNLNSGSPSTTPEEVENIPLVAQTDTLHDQERGFIAAPGKLLSITSRAPAHAPWANAGQGVDVKTNLGAADNLPAAPSPSTAAATEAGTATGATPPAVATVASAPTNISAVSDAVDKGTTSSVVSAVATSAADGPLADATKQGTAIVQTAQGKVAAVGSFAQTATQMASGGVLKPGADTLVNGLVQQGANITAAMPSSVFTGGSGAQNLTSFAQNTTAQTVSVVTNLQKAQTALGTVGAITGKEAPTQVAGLVTAAATVGIQSTTAAIQQVSGTASNIGSSVTKVASGALSNTTGSLSGAAAGAVNSVAGVATGAANQIGGALKAIGSGVAAAALTSSLGGLGGISNALTAMGKVPSLAGLLDQAKGVAASAFNAIKNTLKPLKAGVPQNLTAIAKENAAAAATTSAVVGQGPQGIAMGIVNQVATAAAGTLSSLAAAVGSVSNATGVINNSVAGISGSVNVSSSILSKTTSLAQQASNYAGSSVTTIGGVTGVTSTLAGGATGSLSSLASGVAASAGNALNATISGVKSAVNSVGAISGAGASLTNGGFGGLSSAASVVAQGAAAATSSVLATGLSNLPGGLNTVASVTNNAVNAVNTLPGIGQLSGAIKNAQTAAMTGAGAAANGAFAGAAGQLNGLTSLVSSGLPVGAIAEVQSAISSLSSGPSGIKLPAVGFNTTERAGLTAQIKNVLGDPGIPAPNLVGEISESAKSDAQKLVDQGADIVAINDKILDHLDKIEKARVAWADAESQFPAGDPKIQQLYAAFQAETTNAEYLSLQKQFNEINNISTVASTGTSTVTTSATMTSSVNTSYSSSTFSDTGTGTTLTEGSITTSASIVSSASTSITELTNEVQYSYSNTSPALTSQTSTAVEALQATSTTDKQALNNSLAGITGPAA